MKATATKNVGNVDLKFCAATKILEIIQAAKEFKIKLINPIHSKLKKNPFKRPLRISNGPATFNDQKRASRNS